MLRVTGLRIARGYAKTKPVPRPIKPAAATPPVQAPAAAKEAPKKTAPAKPRFQGLVLYASLFGLGAVVAQFVPLYSVYDAFTLKLPQDGTPEAAAHVAALETELQALPVVQALAADPRYTSHRAWESVPTNVLLELLPGTLSTPGGISIPPVMFTNVDGASTVLVIHLGRRLTGYPFLVHGGILATVLDETLRATVGEVLCSGDKSRVRTTLLSLSYRFPTFADQFVVVRARIEGNEVVGDVETLAGRALVKGTLGYEVAPAPALGWLAWVRSIASRIHA